MPRHPVAPRMRASTVALAFSCALVVAGGVPLLGPVPSSAAEEEESIPGPPATPVSAAEATEIALGTGVATASDSAEIGANDFRISDAGNTDGVASLDARSVAVAYNRFANEYLVAWRGNDETGSLDPAEFEIFGQRIDAATGAEVGANDFRISDMGGDGANDLDANSAPDIAYNSTDNQYLVVWAGDDVTNGAEEVHGQRLSGVASPLGGNFRISSMGASDTDPNARAFDPVVAYNSADNQYLVVWRGDDATGAMIDNENEIWGQRLTDTGAETGTDDFRISDMGTDGSTTFIALSPAVAYNDIDDQYLVVWNGNEVDNELEIYGQRLSDSGAALGTNDFRISEMGPDGDGGYDAFAEVEVAHNGADNEYLVVWRGDDDRGALANGEGEIFGQRLSNGGAETGVDDFRISDMGTDGDTATQADEPALTYLPATNRYLVVWRGEEVDDDREVYGQLLAAHGSQVGTNDLRVSDVDGTGPSSRAPDPPRVAYADSLGHALVVWPADDPDAASLSDNEFEIFGQRLAVGALDFFNTGLGNPWTRFVAVVPPTARSR